MTRAPIRAALAALLPLVWLSAAADSVAQDAPEPLGETVRRPEEVDAPPPRPDEHTRILVCATHAAPPDEGAFEWPYREEATVVQEHDRICADVTRDPASRALRGDTDQVDVAIWGDMHFWVLVMEYPFTGRSVVDRADGHSAGIDGGFLT